MSDGWTVVLIAVGILQGSDDVAAALTQLEVDHVVGVVLEEGLLRLDFAMPKTQTAICLDGPESFTANAPHLPLGSTILRWRLTALRGWKVTQNLSSRKLCAD